MEQREWWVYYVLDTRVLLYIYVYSRIFLYVCVVRIEEGNGHGQGPRPCGLWRYRLFLAACLPPLFASASLSGSLFSRLLKRTRTSQSSFSTPSHSRIRTFHTHVKNFIKKKRRFDKIANYSISFEFIGWIDYSFWTLRTRDRWPFCATNFYAGYSAFTLFRSLNNFDFLFSFKNLSGALEFENHCLRKDTRSSSFRKTTNFWIFITNFHCFVHLNFCYEFCNQERRSIHAQKGPLFGTIFCPLCSCLSYRNSRLSFITDTYLFQVTFFTLPVFRRGLTRSRTFDSMCLAEKHVFLSHVLHRSIPHIIFYLKTATSIAVLIIYWSFCFHMSTFLSSRKTCP